MKRTGYNFGRLCSVKLTKLLLFPTQGSSPAKRSMTNMSMRILDFDAEAADCNGIVKSVGSLIIGVI